MLFHEHAYQVHNEDNHDAWNIPYDYDDIKEEVVHKWKHRE